MRSTTLALALAVTVCGGASALAGSGDRYDCRPYWVEVACNDVDSDCRAHMGHSPGNGLASNPAHSYWYAHKDERRQYPHKLAVWQTGDTALCLGDEARGPDLEGEHGSDNYHNRKAALTAPLPPAE